MSGFRWFVSLEVTGAETQECGCQQPHGAGDRGDAREHEDCFDTQSSSQPLLRGSRPERWCADDERKAPFTRPRRWSGMISCRVVFARRRRLSLGDPQARRGGFAARGAGVPPRRLACPTGVGPAAAQVTGDAADSRNLERRAPGSESRGCRDRAQRRGVRRAGLRPRLARVGSPPRPVVGCRSSQGPRRTRWRLQFIPLCPPPVHRERSIGRPARHGAEPCCRTCGVRWLCEMPHLPSSWRWWPGRLTM